jgi:adenosine deaminase CECR1
MTVADSPKKRKRALSPHPTRKIPIHAGEVKSIDMPLANSTIDNVFDSALRNTSKQNAYVQSHHDLLKLEEQDAWDREAKPKANSRSKDDIIERRAATIILAIREYERNVVFGNLASEAIPDPDTRDMGGQFLTNKPRIDAESKLFEIAQMVPKGCLLHLHFNAELHPERLLERARETPNMYIRSIRPLRDQKDLDLTETVFNVLDHDKVQKGVNLFSPDYEGNATNWRTEEYKWKVWMLWSDFQAEFEKRFGKDYAQQADSFTIETPSCCAIPGHVPLNPAENWLKSKMVLSEKEAYDATQTVNG